MSQILLVFDDTEDLQKITLLLRLGDFKVKIALSVGEAEEALEKGFLPDLLITGGEVRGIEADDIARQLQSAVKGDPAILAVAPAEEELDPALFDCILRTPCRVSRLETALESLGFGVFKKT